MILPIHPGGRRSLLAELGRKEGRAGFNSDQLSGKNIYKLIWHLPVLAKFELRLLPAPHTTSVWHTEVQWLS